MATSRLPTVGWDGTKALKLQEETLAFRERVLPADHPHCDEHHKLAHTYGGWDGTEALKLKEETLAFYKRVRRRITLTLR